jgi:hypothetical protein
MTQRIHLEMDEQWLDEWVTWGLRELDHHLARHAQFANWLETHRAERRSARRAPRQIAHNGRC